MACESMSAKVGGARVARRPARGGLRGVRAPMQHFQQQRGARREARPAKPIINGASSRRAGSRRNERGPVSVRADGGETTGWRVATVVENKSATADGKLRTLVLSIEDDVRQFKGRRFGKIPSLERLECPRWIDAFSAPGQYVYARCGGDDDDNADRCSTVTLQERICLSSSPYDAHTDSAFLSASIVQILVSRGEGDRAAAEEVDGLALGHLGPGDQFEVSDIQGQGFQSLFHDEDRLGLSLEAGKNLILIGSGAGIGPLRSVLDWVPVQALAGQHNVSLFYHHGESLESAAYLDLWDQWRRAGIHVRPVQGKEASVIEAELFDAEGQIRSNIKTQNTNVLISGFPGKVTARLSRLLANNSLPNNKVFFCDY